MGPILQQRIHPRMRQRTGLAGSIMEKYGVNRRRTSYVGLILRKHKLWLPQPPAAQDAGAPQTHIHPVRLIYMGQQGQQPAAQPSAWPEQIIRLQSIYSSTSIAVHHYHEVSKAAAGEQPETLRKERRPEALSPVLQHPLQQESGIPRNDGHYMPEQVLSRPPAAPAAPAVTDRSGGDNGPLQSRISAAVYGNGNSPVGGSIWNNQVIQRITTNNSGLTMGPGPQRYEQSIRRQLHTLYSYIYRSGASPAAQHFTEVAASGQKPGDLRREPLQLAAGRQAAHAAGPAKGEAGAAPAASATGRTAAVSAAVAAGGLPPGTPEALRVAAGQGIARVLERMENVQEGQRNTVRMAPAELAYAPAARIWQRLSATERAVTWRNAGITPASAMPPQPAVRNAGTGLQLGMPGLPDEYSGRADQAALLHRAVRRQSSIPYAPETPDLPEPALAEPSRPSLRYRSLILRKEPVQKGGREGSPQQGETMQTAAMEARVQAEAKAAAKPSGRGQKISAEEINQLAERVYQVLEKRMSIRRDRRGLR